MMVFVSDRNSNQNIYTARISADYEMEDIKQVTSGNFSDRHPVWQPKNK